MVISDAHLPEVLSSAYGAGGVARCQVEQHFGAVRPVTGLTDDLCQQGRAPSHV